MVRFSCFNAHINSNKPKRAVQSSIEALCDTVGDSSQIQAPKASSNSLTLNSLLLEAICDTTKQAKNLLTMEHRSKSEEIKGKFDIEGDMEVVQTGCLKKSQSLGSGLHQEGRVVHNNETEYESDQGFSSYSHDQNVFVVTDGSKDQGVSTPYHCLHAPNSESVQVSADLGNVESISSTGESQHPDKEGAENSDTLLSGDYPNDSVDHSSRAPAGMVKSCSVPNFGPSTPTSDGHSPFQYLCSQSRSSEDLHGLDMICKEDSIHECETQVVQECEREDNICRTEKNNLENSMDDGYDLYNYSAFAKDWIVPDMDEVNLPKNLQGGSSIHHQDELPSKDFKIKRIEEWVNDLQHCTPLEGTNELPYLVDHVKRDSVILNGTAATKVDNKHTPGMETAKRYISSLSASATTFQLANHGLVAIPFLSAFVSLRVLNLSGNAIVRITAGALPRGLHALNLSKNNISTIEGLRELSRLRVLDLSYNRILRIGHGLASCSSLKELYLAGNKISEVEGLHRLLKLTVLDLRFNKISTAKCLGQLAANYNSLQAIGLEGNPAQKNVGDEQLKKYLQGLLPHLAYFNRQHIKTSTLKDSTDRSVRLGIGSHQFDRTLRSENKSTRKSSHGVASHKPSSSTTHGRKTPTAISPPKRSRGRLSRPLPAGNVATTNHRHYHHFDFGSKLLNFRPELSMRRTQSQGAIGAV